MNHCLILGCGYTGRRVARRLLERGFAVTATTRDPIRQSDLKAAGCRVATLDVTDEATRSSVAELVDEQTRVLLSIPTLTETSGDTARLDDPTARIVEALGKAPARVVYLSTTGIYGETKHVDETTPIAPVTERQHRRAEAERAVTAGPRPSLILRPAAIYGPGRGVHTALRAGRYRLAGDGANFVSRIQVDDLAALAAAALESGITGAYPVADKNPCTSREMAGYCADLLGMPMPPSVENGEIDETRRADRRVDGRAICKLLGVELRYPSYREGVTAALAEEGVPGQHPESSETVSPHPVLERHGTE